ncbi:MAG: pyridoxal phosphate-dependent aminotransferase [Lentimicrobiaceae bacterium]|nr:pyridoxal phosphate-dependent aminotransferase [Lentimicrobiaceae bacterium]
MEILSQRIQKLSESETLAMTRRSRELQSQGHDVINLSIGEPDFNTPGYIKDAAKQAIDNNVTHYPPVAGFAELRKAISEKFKRDNNLDYAPEQIVVSTGGKQALANAILCLVNPGDEVIVPVPYWVSYRELIKLAEGKAVYLPTTIGNNFKVTPAQLESAITDRTKILIFSSPCNPSGSVYTRDELKGIAEVVARHENIFIISDEIYELINFGGKHASIAGFDFIKERVVTVNGVSKGFAMTGWRLGYIGAPKVIAAACDKIQGQFTSGTGTISQMAAIAAMKTNPESSVELQTMRKAFHERRDLLLKLLNDIPGFKTNIPQGAFYIFPDVSWYFRKTNGNFTINNAGDLCNFLLNNAHVALVSGEAFGDPACIRFSYATSNDRLIEAAARIKKALAEFK